MHNFISDTAHALYSHTHTPARKNINDMILCWIHCIYYYYYHYFLQHISAHGCRLARRRFYTPLSTNDRAVHRYAPLVVTRTRHNIKPFYYYKRNSVVLYTRHIMRLSDDGLCAIKTTSRPWNSLYRRAPPKTSGPSYSAITYVYV